MTPTVDEAKIAAAADRLRAIRERIIGGVASGAREALASIDARKAVLGAFQPVFAPTHLRQITAEEFRSFLVFKNNQHWMNLQRHGPALTADMPRLRKALGILLDNTRPIAQRLNQLVPLRGPGFVPYLGRAILTPILLIHDPDSYGVWNRVSEEALKQLDAWPPSERQHPFGDAYKLVNAVLRALAAAVGTDLWTLDSLLWASLSQSDNSDATLDEAIGSGPEAIQRGTAEFGLERHLQEFLRDNWSRTDLGAEWDLYTEDGEEVGYEYRCDVGRIDLLAHHRTEPKWLVIELKRGQTGDVTVGQVLRYIGWVQRKLAAAGETVEGLIIAHEADTALQYALEALSNVTFRKYEVDFRLIPESLPTLNSA